MDTNGFTTVSPSEPNKMSMDERRGGVWAPSGQNDLQTAGTELRGRAVFTEGNEAVSTLCYGREQSGQPDEARECEEGESRRDLPRRGACDRCPLGSRRNKVGVFLLRRGFGGRGKPLPHLDSQVDEISGESHSYEGGGTIVLPIGAQLSERRIYPGINQMASFGFHF